LIVSELEDELEEHEIPKDIEVHKQSIAGVRDVDKLEDGLEKLADSMTTLENHFEYLEGREIQHRDLVEDTTSRLMYLTIIESVTLLCMNLGQLLYIKYCFNTPRRY